MNSASLYRSDRDCRICLSSDVKVVLSLTPTPLEDMFVSKGLANIEQPTFPLDVALCRSCGYLFLPHVVSPEASYSEYLYESKVTLGLSSHYDSYAKEITTFASLPPSSFVVDLGSNDGTMLSGFKKIGMRVLGIEPAPGPAQAAIEAGIPTRNCFFTLEVAQAVSQENGKADVITANYMYANIDDLHSFTKSVSELLSDSGLFVVQTGYHPEQMKLLMFDYIYHEHYSYFTVKVLERLFRMHGLELIDVAVFPAKGGSIRAIAQKFGGKFSRRDSVDQLMRDEADAGIELPETFMRFSDTLDQRKTETLNFLRRAREEGKKIVGFGASHSTTTLLYHFGLAEYVSYIVDDNTRKHGLFSPGYHIPVYPSEKLLQDRPDVVVLLAWQYQDAIMKRHEAYIAAGGTFVVPLPVFRVEGPSGTITTAG
jgi:C-methyltransferase C-terminal domain/Putative zinc binding domain/Methyltransferase domain